MTTTIRDIIAEELLNPTFEMTRQYLKILEVEYEGNKPKIVKIDIQENQSIAYVEVKNESFYLEFICDTTDDIEIIDVDTFPFIRVGYTLTSEELTTGKLLNITSIKPTRTFKKGDFFSNGKFESTCNGLEFETFSEPGPLESKIKYLLDILEADNKGIKELSKQTGCNNIFVTIVFHIGNGNFTGLYLESHIINRLSKLGLQLTFDIYSSGVKFENK